MKKPSTIFDKQFCKEDVQLLKSDKNTAGKENKDMLLRQYNTEIFDPEFKELEKPLPREIELLIQKTRMNKNPIPFLRRWSGATKIFALAASLVIVCGLVFFASRIGDNSTHDPSFSPDYRVRGQNVPPVAGVGAAVPDKKECLLAYLVDIQGKVKVVRSQKEIVPTSCEILYKDDVVVLAAGAKAKIMYEDAFFDVAGAKEYRIQAPDPVIQENGKATAQRMEPTITTRGRHLGLSNVPSMIMPPRTLLAAVVTPITRAGNKTVAIYSPRGASYTDRPVLKIGGDPQKTYTVTIFEDGEVIGKPVNIKGQMVMPWSAISDAPIKDIDDAGYEVMVQCDGKIVINNSAFWRLSKKDREKLDAALKYFDSVTSVQDRYFLHANALYASGCYSEAIILIEEKKLTEVPFFEKIKRNCEKNLK